MKTGFAAVIILIVASFVMAEEPPPVLTCRMGNDVQSPIVTKEQLALVIEIRDQLWFSSTMIDGGVGLLTFDGGSLRYRLASDPDGASFTIRITGAPVADGISEYWVDIQYLGPNRGPSTQRAVFGEFSSFVKANHVHVIGEGDKVLDWAAKEIDRLLKSHLDSESNSSEQ